jgi:hypothetical protein
MHRHRLTAASLLCLGVARGADAEATMDARLTAVAHFAAAFREATLMDPKIVIPSQVLTGHSRP